MDTQYLESFVLVVELGSVAETARRSDLTTAGVTQRLRALERELGMSLVSRAGRTVKPTEAGWAILPTAQQILADTRDLRAIANGKNISGELRLGAVSSALTGLLPPILSQLSIKHPDLALLVSPGSSSDLYGKVVSGELDAAVMVEPDFALPKTCEWITWRVEPLVLLAHSHVASEDVHHILNTEPFIRYGRKQWDGRLAESYLKDWGLHPQDRYELDSLAAIAVLVDRGLGVSLVPDWPRPWPEGLKLRKMPLPNPHGEHRVGILWRRVSARISLVKALLSEARSQFELPTFLAF